MGRLVAAGGIAERVGSLMQRMSGAFIASLFILGPASASAEALPDCTHWTSAFVFTEFMDRARVRGTGGQRLYLRPANPELCSSLLDPRDCKARAYLIPKDIVTIGHACGAWAYVMFERKRSRSTGWVELEAVPLPS